MKLSEIQLEQWKQAFAKSGIIYETAEEYEEAINNLTGFFDVLIQIDLQQKKKANPRTTGTFKSVD